jgi:hypothetical protein
MRKSWSILCLGILVTAICAQRSQGSDVRSYDTDKVTPSLIKEDPNENHGPDQEYHFTFRCLFHSPDMTPEDVFYEFKKELWGPELENSHLGAYLVNWVWNPGPMKKDGLADIQFEIHALDATGVAEVDHFITEHTGKVVLGNVLLFNRIRSLLIPVQVNVRTAKSDLYYDSNWVFSPTFQPITDEFSALTVALKNKDKAKFLSLISPWFDSDQLSKIAADFDQATIQIFGTTVFLAKADRQKGHEPGFISWYARTP